MRLKVIAFNDEVIMSVCLEYVDCPLCLPLSISISPSLFLSLPPPALMLDVSLWEEVPEMLAGPYISVKISMNKLTF